MKIYPPQLVKVDNKIIISSEFETENSKDKLWYEFDSQFQSYLITEQSDAFVVGLLLLALKCNEDIYVVGAISAKLKYQLNHYLIPALCLAFKNFENIKIYSDFESEVVFSQEYSASATGMSCGVDSLATLIEHQDCKGQLKISHLTYFNAGSHSDNGGSNGRNLFNKRYQRISKFSEEIGIPIIKIDTNLSEILQMKFVSTHTIRNMSCILNLQKLLKNYYYASAFRFDRFSINDEISDKYDLLTLQMLSTESIRFYSAVSDKTRAERTMLISDYVKAHTYLDVCVDPNSSKSDINCSKCDKCMRTQLTLEVSGKLEQFNRVFNLDIYEKNKNKYVGKLIRNKNRNEMDSDLFNLLIYSGFRINVFHFIEAEKIRYNEIKKKLKMSTIVDL